MDQDSPAWQSFEQARDFWSSQWSDTVEIQLDLRYEPLPGNTLGSAESEHVYVSYTEWSEALTADATSAADRQMTASLPQGDTFAPYINRTEDNPHGRGSVRPYVDDDLGPNNQVVRLTRANAKALGVLSKEAEATDATISINSNFPFDYDLSDGVDANHYSLTGILVHELGHALGFVSGVDWLDYNSNGFYFTDDSLDYVSALDFLRFSEDSEAAGADFDWTADRRAKYLSIDGGTTPLTDAANDWATGSIHGDGYQSSHWRLGSGLGNFEPILSRGATIPVSEWDLLALDVIGWDLASRPVPEPTHTWILLGLLLGCVARRRR